MNEEVIINKHLITTLAEVVTFMDGISVSGHRTDAVVHVESAMLALGEDNIERNE